MTKHRRKTRGLLLLLLLLLPSGLAGAAAAAVRLVCLILPSPTENHDQSGTRRTDGRNDYSDGQTDRQTDRRSNPLPSVGWSKNEGTTTTTGERVNESPNRFNRGLNSAAVVICCTDGICCCCSNKTDWVYMYQCIYVFASRTRTYEGKRFD